MGKKVQKRPKKPKKPKSIWRFVRNFQDDDALKEIWKAIQSTKKADPCWCDSRDKYKDCHLNRSHEAPFRIHEYIKMLRKFYDKGYCLHPDAHINVCVAPIVKAHSVQKSGGLSQIAINGRLYNSLCK